MKAKIFISDEHFSFMSSPPSSSSSSLLPSSRRDDVSQYEPGIDCRYHITHTDASLSSTLTSSSLLRHVHPYPYRHEGYTKKRWLNQPLLTILQREYPHVLPNYYQEALAQGRVQVNDQVVSSNYLMRNSDRLTHSLHRHEPPVLYQPRIDVIEQTDHLLVVNKPPSLPVHPCGRFFHNSLTALLRYEGYGVLLPVHRLDRWTTGVLILAKDPVTATQMMTLMRSHSNMTKVYYARVKGRFPESPVEVDVPLGVVEGKAGKRRVIYGEKSKVAVTHFRRLHYNGHTSLVECLPKTGRTHQIRLHLQHINHPIANDPIYGGHVNTDNARALDHLPVPLPDRVPGCLDCLNQCTQRIRCTHIWLHAHSYTGPDFHYSAPRPSWAYSDYDSQSLVDVEETGVRLNEVDVGQEGIP